MHATHLIIIAIIYYCSNEEAPLLEHMDVNCGTVKSMYKEKHYAKKTRDDRLEDQGEEMRL